MLPCAHRECAAARRSFDLAIDLHGIPEKLTIDQSGANTSEIPGLRVNSGFDLEMRQSKYPNNLAEIGDRASSAAVELYSLAF
ncbi:MAG: hypothetical protein H7Z19_16960 [Chitinophagaceae bacterium]|nr:hypothetical protein [Rubrivivax sp.]